jgi:hypothetical protein
MKKENLYKYDEEAEALIKLVLETANPTLRNSRVASWLREYVAARAYGCTGLTVDPDGPTIDAAASGEDERPEDYHREARMAYDPGAGPFPHGYGNT